MTITAKYAATCPVCNCAITPGQKIEWSKGSKARHTVCGATGTATTQTASAPKSRGQYARSGKWTGCSCGSREDGYGQLIPARNNCWTCQHDGE